MKRLGSRTTRIERVSSIAFDRTQGLILVEVSVKAITMLLISVVVSVKVAYSHRLKAQSYLHATYSSGSICVSGLSVHKVTDCSHRAITMLLILVEVHVKVAYRSTTVTDCSHSAINMRAQRLSCMFISFYVIHFRLRSGRIMV